MATTRVTWLCLGNHLFLGSRASTTVPLPAHCQPPGVQRGPWALDHMASELQPMLFILNVSLGRSRCAGHGHDTEGFATNVGVFQTYE